MNISSKEPSLNEFVSFATEFTRRPSFNSVCSENLEVYTTIFESQAIHNFIASSKGSASLVSVFDSPAGLGCLISQLKNAPGSAVPDLLQLLTMVLDQVNLKSMLASEYKETMSLFWGSRILNIASLRASGEHADWIGDPRLYAQWLAKRTISQNITDPKLFDKGLKLGAPQDFYSPFVGSQLLGRLFTDLRPSQQEFMLTHAVIPSNPSSRLLIDLHVDPLMMARICYKLPSSIKVVRVSIVLAREASKLLEVVTYLIKEWSSAFLIRSMPLLNQQTLVQFIIGACMSLTSAEAAQISHSGNFTEGVSNHLTSTSTSIRELGTLVAEVYAKRSGADLEFGINYSGYEWWVGFDDITDTEMTPITADKVTEVLMPKRDDSDNEDAKDNEGDSDDEDEEIVEPPYYLKDLVAYLRSDKYAEIVAALEVGPELIARKATFGSEVPQYAQDLLDAATSLNDKYSITKFGERRQAILNAVLAADPSQAPGLTRMFVTGDWSLAQRQSLLAAIAYAAYELSNASGDHKGELMPAKLHKLFISDTDKTVRQIGSDASAKKNRFSPVSNKFFFPLLDAQPRLRKSSYDSIIYAQWLRTLSLIVVQAYPTQYITEMVSELWSLLGTLIAQSHWLETVILDAIYTALSMLISVGRGIIIQKFPSDIGKVFDEVLGSLEDVSVLETVQGGKAAAAQLADMMQHVNSVVMKGD